MAILKVARLGHPVLRKISEKIPVEKITTPEIQQLIEDMIETMHEYDGVGLAAPQVHRSLRLCVIEIGESAKNRYAQNAEAGLHVFINPEVKVLTQQTSTFWEGCLSVPGLRGLVERPNKIHVKYFDRKAQPCEIQAEGFLATVLQHEFDHLDGKLYIDRLVNTTQLTFEEEYEKYWQTAQE